MFLPPIGKFCPLLEKKSADELIFHYSKQSFTFIFFQNCMNEETLNSNFFSVSVNRFRLFKEGLLELSAVIESKVSFDMLRQKF